jgi:carbamoyltransferase
MALSCYGSYDNNIEILKDNKFNKQYFKKNLGRSKGDFLTAAEWIPGLSDLKDNKKSLDFIHTFQKGCEEYCFNLFKRFNNKKILFTGGVAQNILINTLLNEKTSNTIYVDPMSADHGISLGMNVFYTNNKLKKRNTYYLGFKPKYGLLDKLFNKHTIKESNEEEVARFLTQDPVAIFQGGSEQGQRGLGNRSLLMNAEHKNCLEKINKIKKREWYRPFACSILNENLDEWFEIDNKKEPYYMMFVYKAKKKVSNIVSVENTCRLQAIKKENNKNYYNLINEFKKQTKLPYVLNTSLNLPGTTLVEDLFDLCYIFENSDLKYIWLPDIRKMIIKHGY